MLNNDSRNCSLDLFGCFTNGIIRSMSFYIKILCLNWASRVLISAYAFFISSKEDWGKTVWYSEFGVLGCGPAAYPAPTQKQIAIITMKKMQIIHFFCSRRMVIAKHSMLSLIFFSIPPSVSHHQRGQRFLRPPYAPQFGQPCCTQS